MKKLLAVFVVCMLCTTCVFAAKYKINSSGTVKNNAGNVVSPTTSTSSPYNVYNAQNYVSNNVVNSTMVPTIELVMDYSGSMQGSIEQAKKAMSSIIAQIPSTTNVGFRVFGQNSHGNNPVVANSTLGEVKKITKKGKIYSILTKANSSPSAYMGSTKGYCSATTQISPVQKANLTSLINGMNSVDIGGSTPLVYGLERAINQDFAGLAQTFPKKIVLVTDGGENCGADPCAFARALMNSRSDVHIDVVLIGGSFSNLNCLAKITGGHTYSINDLSKFSTVMVQAMTSTPTTVKNNNNSNQKYEFYSD